MFGVALISFFHSSHKLGPVCLYVFPKDNEHAFMERLVHFSDSSSDY